MLAVPSSLISTIPLSAFAQVSKKRLNSSASYVYNSILKERLDLGEKAGLQCFNHDPFGQVIDY